MLSRLPVTGRVLLLALVCLAFSTVSTAQTPSASDSQPVVRPAPDQSEVEGMKEDLKQMRVILNQMANNLAFVSDSQSPLKHQFQLEIDMWQVLMMRMQRRLNAIEGTSSTPKATQ